MLEDLLAVSIALCECIEVVLSFHSRCSQSFFKSSLTIFLGLNVLSEGPRLLFLAYFCSDNRGSRKANFVIWVYQHPRLFAYFIYSQLFV